MRPGLFGLAVLVLAGSASAAVIAPPPGQSVVLLEERVLLVYDPLTATQTIVVQHVFEGTATPFGLIIAVPKPARVTVASDRLRKAIRNRLHPRGKVQRTLDVQFHSVAASCALRDVGDDLDRDEGEKKKKGVRAQASSLGNAPEPLHDWLLGSGFTLAPAQAAWLSRLRALGWHTVGVVVQPPTGGPAPPPKLRGPVLAVTHAAVDGPIFAAGHPPFALTARVPSGTPGLEVAVLTEWAVALDAQGAPEPFYADAISTRSLSRLATAAGGLPWAFRRNGALTAYELPRPEGLGVIRFVRTDPRPTTRPRPTPRMRAHTFNVPFEAIGLLVFLGFWGWFRFLRRGASRRMRRL